ncbi:hypothetical protein UPYG_G00274820 [Umbra pygmaea]|uniref:Granulins domain-containing protein n=1 Tax=Umbra pygmaea TaxID=75934 RepID=A0ABD0W2T2_UMBPY
MDVLELPAKKPELKTSRRRKMWSTLVLVFMVARSASCFTICPDGKVCPDQSSCCLTNGEYTCCPGSGGVAEKLSSPFSPALQSDVLPVQKEDSAEDSSVSVVWCDSTSYCPDGTRCCRHPAGFWTCCSYYNGVCCRDGLHCCPYGYRCDITSSRCLMSDSLTYRFVQKQVSTMIQATKISEMDNKVDNQVAAEKLSSPFSPVLQSDVLPVQKEDSAEDSSVSVVWCDSTSYCPDGTRCCRHPAGFWTCCSYYNGVCCRDGLHCCPYGYRCDITSSRCLMSDSLTYPFVQKQVSTMIQATKISEMDNKVENQVAAEKLSSPFSPVLQSDVLPVQKEDSAEDSSVSVVWCDSTSYCPDGTRCCRHPAGFWTCCSYYNGVCCRDGLHCCPYGYRCDITSSRCLMSDSLTYPFVQKQVSTMVKATKISEMDNKVDNQ